MARDLTCSPEVRGIVAFLEASAVPARVTSTFRPGARTAAGALSRHGRKLAVDVAGPRPSRDSEALGAVFQVFAPVAAHLHELIYAGPQVGRNVKRGRWVHKYAQALHHDHVHIAVEPGVDLARLASDRVAPDTGEALPEVEVAAELEPLDEPVDAVASPQGGVWVVTRDGGVRTYDRAGRTPFHGSYWSLRPEQRLGERTFVEIHRNGRGGYDLISSGDERYSFPAT